GPPGDVAEYAGYNAEINGKVVANGTPVSPAGGYVNGIDSPNGAISIDGSGKVWILNQGLMSGIPSEAELSSASGALLQTDFGYEATGCNFQQPLTCNSVLSSGQFGNFTAIDNAGDVFIVNPFTGGSAELYELLAGGSSANDGGIGIQIYPSIDTTSAPIAIDGTGRLLQMTTAQMGLPVALAE